MPFELNEIKHIRKKFNLTQKDLAKRADVSQSLIAKIEAGRIDPTYSKTKKILDTLNTLTEKQDIKAEQIMKKKVIGIDPSDDIKNTINKMRKYGISQLPVVDDHKCVGLVSETIILEALLDHKVKKVDEVMKDCPPVISKNTSINIISNLLKFYPIIIVSDKGKINGIITKSDILGVIYKN